MITIIFLCSSFLSFAPRQSSPILFSLSALPPLDKHGWLTNLIAISTPFFLAVCNHRLWKARYLLCQIPWQPGLAMGPSYSQWDISGSMLGGGGVFWERLCFYTKGTSSKKKIAGIVYFPDFLPWRWTWCMGLQQPSCDHEAAKIRMKNPKVAE